MHKRIKHALFHLADSRPFGAVVSGLERLPDRNSELLRILTYHRIAEPDEYPTLDPSLISSRPKAFEQQMLHLIQNYRVLSLAEALEAIESGECLPPRSVLVTFDDAYLDFAKHAWPVLKRFEIPVTLFVPTAFPDQSDRHFWWDRLHTAMCANTACETPQTLETPVGTFVLDSASSRYAAYRTLGKHVKSLPNDDAWSYVDTVADELGSPAPQSNCVMSWDKLRQLDREGVTLAPHTQTHPLMERVSLEQVGQEARGSLADLRREIGDHVPAVLAYPAGSVNEEVAETLAKEDFDLAVTTERGVNHFPTQHRMQFKRINVGMKTPLSLFRAQLCSQVWRIPCS